MSEEKRQEQEDRKRIDDAVKTLSEHFDTVQIFVTRHEGVLGGTVASTIYEGNFYARYGQIREWLLKTEEDMKDSRRSYMP